MFDAAAESLNASTVDKNVVQAVWDKLLPGEQLLKTKKIPA